MSSYYVEENQRSDPQYLPSTAREYEYNDAHYAKQPRGGQVEIRVAPRSLAGDNINDYCGLSLFACLCCFWPLGAVAIVKSLTVNSMIEQGDFRRANSYSRSAKRFSIAAIVTGSILILIAIVIVVVIVATGNFQRRS